MILDLLDPEAVRFAHALYRLWRFNRRRRRRVAAEPKPVPQPAFAGCGWGCAHSLREVLARGQLCGPHKLTACTPAWRVLLTEVTSLRPWLPSQQPFDAPLVFETPGGQVTVRLDPYKHGLQTAVRPPAPR